MSVVTNDKPKLKKKDFSSDQDKRWCPGCGDYAILAQTQKQMPTFGRKREEFVFVCEDENGEEDVEALNRVHDDEYLTINWGLS